VGTHLLTSTSDAPLVSQTIVTGGTPLYVGNRRCDYIFSWLVQLGDASAWRKGEYAFLGKSGDLDLGWTRWGIRTP
jgi:hypothetical protein